MANGLFSLFRFYVLDGNHDPFIPFNPNGDVTDPAGPDFPASADWMVDDDDLVDRFKRVLWHPLGDLSDVWLKELIGPGVFFEQAKEHAPEDWHILLPHLQRFNMAMDEPEIHSIQSVELSDGSLGIKITGSGFAQHVPFLTDPGQTASGTRVTIGGEDIPDEFVIVSSSEELLVKIPDSVQDTGHVVVTTRAGHAIVGGAN